MVHGNRVFFLYVRHSLAFAILWVLCDKAQTLTYTMPLLFSSNYSQEWQQTEPRTEQVFEPTQKAAFSLLFFCFNWISTVQSYTLLSVGCPLQIQSYTEQCSVWRYICAVKFNSASWAIAVIIRQRKCIWVHTRHSAATRLWFNFLYFSRKSSRTSSLIWSGFCLCALGLVASLNKLFQECFIRAYSLWQKSVQLIWIHMWLYDDIHEAFSHIFHCVGPQMCGICGILRSICAVTFGRAENRTHPRAWQVLTWQRTTLSQPQNGASCFFPSILWGHYTQ